MASESDISYGLLIPDSTRNVLIDLKQTKGIFCNLSDTGRSTLYVLSGRGDIAWEAYSVPNSFITSLKKNDKRTEIFNILEGDFLLNLKSGYSKMTFAMIPKTIPIKEGFNVKVASIDKYTFLIPM